MLGFAFCESEKKERGGTSKTVHNQTGHMVAGHVGSVLAGTLYGRNFLLIIFRPAHRANRRFL